MHFRRPILCLMDAERAAWEFAELYRELYLRLYQRIDPRAWRPSQEALLVLQHLASTGPLTVSEAARHFDRSQASVSELVARLIRRGLLARMTDERDRRRHLVWLTDAGHALLREQIQVLAPQLLAAALSRMDRDERDRLIEGMRVLLTACEVNKPERREE